MRLRTILEETKFPKQNETWKKKFSQNETTKFSKNFCFTKGDLEKVLTKRDLDGSMDLDHQDLALPSYCN